MIPALPRRRRTSLPVCLFLSLVLVPGMAPAQPAPRPAVQPGLPGVPGLPPTVPIVVRGPAAASAARPVQQPATSAVHRPFSRHHPSRRRGPAVGRSRPAKPLGRVGAANAAARVEPDPTGFVNAIQRYAWSEGALYQVYAKPGSITDIALEPGEQLAGTGPVAAGDTVRWIIGDTASGAGAAARIHILVKPVRPDIATNLVINTDRRTYHLELRANPAVYMASVSWAYPEGELIALRAAQDAAARAAPAAAGLDLARLNFGYALSGDKPAWRPVRVFDDGRQVFVEFPESVAEGEMPPLFVLGKDGSAELVNYRVSGHFMIVDRLFAAAELRLGGKKDQQRVAITLARKGRS